VTAPAPTVSEWPGWLRLDGWAGRSKAAVVVVGETSMRYRIRAAGPDPVKLAGRSRWISGIQTALVPKHAVTHRGES
jgi:hypothetical protein